MKPMDHFLHHSMQPPDCLSFGRGEAVRGLGNTTHMEGMGTLFLKWGDESLFIY